MCKIWKLVNDHKPKIIVMCPETAAWLGAHKNKIEETDVVDLCAELARHQFKHGRYFVFCIPLTARCGTRRPYRSLPKPKE